MENWLYDWKTVNKMTSHYKTGESLPVEMFSQIQKGNATLQNCFLLFEYFPEVQKIKHSFKAVTLNIKVASY